MRRTTAAAAGAGLFGIGCWVGVLIHRRQSEETHIHLYRRLLVAEANQDHALCQQVERTLSGYIANQEMRLDVYEQAAQVVDAAEQITREGS